MAIPNHLFPPNNGRLLTPPSLLPNVAIKRIKKVIIWSPSHRVVYWTWTDWLKMSRGTVWLTHPPPPLIFINLRVPEEIDGQQAIGISTDPAIRFASPNPLWLMPSWWMMRFDNLLDTPFSRSSASSVPAIQSLATAICKCFPDLPSNIAVIPFKPNEVSFEGPHRSNRWTTNPTPPQQSSILKAIIDDLAVGDPTPFNASTGFPL